MTNNKFINTITSIFEKIAINRTRQALAFLSDNELEAMGITRTSLDTGDFYNYKEVANFPTKKISRIKSTKLKPLNLKYFILDIDTSSSSYLD